jgi:hypothetical protein
VAGGLDVPKPDGTGKTIIANAAVLVSFDMERRQPPIADLGSGT